MTCVDLTTMDFVYFPPEFRLTNIKMPKRVLEQDSFSQVNLAPRAGDCEDSRVNDDDVS